MTLATFHHHRPMLPVFSVLVAGAALALGAVAIATDDVGTVTPQPSPVVVTSVAEKPAVPASTRAGSAGAGVDAGECAFRAPRVVVPC
jgi:hypothetical protein